jgi:hypothetical protein
MTMGALAPALGDVVAELLQAAAPNTRATAAASAVVADRDTGRPPRVMDATFI